MTTACIITFAILLYFLLNSIQGRILITSIQTHNNDINYDHTNSPIYISPSIAPNANNNNNDDDDTTNDEYYKLAPSPIYSHSSVDHYSHAHAPSPSKAIKVNTSVLEPIITKMYYDVRSFGAVGNGLKDDTFAFKSAWESACQVENATIVAPKGYSFLLLPLIFMGPCKSGLVFQVEGTIVAPNGPNSWPKKISKRQWIIFYKIHGLTFQGGGLIDGKGDKWWILPCKPHRAIRFFGSSNVTVKGLKLINSPQFHIRFDSCQSVQVDYLEINSPANSPNTDGIHVENSIDVNIYDSIISNGDDCISIGASSHNLDIKNVTCGPSHGISIGSLGERNSRACVSNITVTNSVIKHSDNGVRIKTWQGGSGCVSGITFNNIQMDTVRNPIMIDQYYCTLRRCRNQTSAVSIANISYYNIKGTYDPRGPPVHLGCSDSVPCTNITISGLELQPALVPSPSSSYQYAHSIEPFCWSAYGSLCELTIPPVHCLLVGLPNLHIPVGRVGLC
ncbi:hypothetical protein RND81_04G221100 [Saponaria officinalis]|uniref:Polygalacturonase n=1 Tax=Saponaria officinalis TaxID=3572 RepID=A0AAW1LG31_SAPOF